jgi:oligopeptide transport system substrate-binding protein
MRVIAAVLVVFLLALPTAPASAQQTLAIGNGSEPETLDPHKATDLQSAEIIFQLFEGLVSYGPDASIVPGVAESWARAPDGLSYIFHLRHDALWSDGSKVTAEDFVYSFRRAVDPRTGSSYQFILYPIKNAQEITEGKEKDLTKLGVIARDASTLEILLRGPTPYFLGLLVHQMAMPVPHQAIEAFGDQWLQPGKLVGNGAYRLVERIPQSKIRVTKNELYWDAARVALDSATFLPIENETPEYNAYRAGEIDITNTVPSPQLPAIRKDLARELQSGPLLGTYYYAFNLTRPPFNGDAKLRQALAEAVDRDILVAKITEAGEQPAYSFTPPAVRDYTPPTVAWAAKSKEDKLAEAKRLFAEAGYGPQHPLSFELLYNTLEAHKRIALAITAMWKQAFGAGIDIRLRNEEFKVKLAQVRARQYDLTREGWIADYNDVSNFADQLASDAGEMNAPGYRNPDYDRLVHQGAVTLDATERGRLYAEAESRMLADMPVLPLYFYVTKRLVKPYVSGWQSNVADIHLLKYVSVKR